MPTSVQTRRRSRPILTFAIGTLTLGVLALGCTSTDDPTADSGSGSGSGAGQRLRLTVLSTDASRVTGGDLLLGITGAEPSDTPSVEVDGKTVELPAAALTTTTAPGSSTKRVETMIDGLADGPHKITVKSGGSSASIEVVNHPISGPVFSGAQLPMPTCTTEDFGLGPAIDENCSAATRVTYKYVDGTGKLQLLDPATPPAADAQIIRVETGVINRGIFTVMWPTTIEAATADDTDPTGNSGWNRRLIYRFGGGCGTTYSQGFNLMGDPDPTVFAKGYAVATSTLNTFQVTCNDVISAETAMMVKEHFIETYGLPDLTIGEGGSGGAIQQLLIAQNYPGILDAIAPSLPFPDAISISGGVLDCALLNRYYRTTGSAWTDVQRAAANGHLTTRTCDFWEQTFVPGVDPSKCGFGDGLSSATAALPGLGNAKFPQPPADMIYNATTNPTGLRCTLQDMAVAVYGKDPATGFARRPWDNVGLQYGLSALAAGTLNIDQFLSLNESIGSFDIDGQWQAARSTADEGALKTSYATGRVVVGGGDLRKIPIILVNFYTDPLGDIHDRYRVFTIRDRLADPDGEQAANLAIWTRGLPPGKSLIDSLSGAVSLGTEVIEALDTWATALLDERPAAGSDVLSGEQILAARPEAATNTCFEADGTVIEAGDDVYDGPGPCTDPFPAKGDPRTVAGAPIIENVIKCDLMSTDAAVTAGLYPAALSTAERARLDAIFPDGVCDWSKPGIGQVPLGKPWQSFGP